jgi:hypothetical protein
VEPTIVIHSLDHARAALAAAAAHRTKVTLASAAGAGGYAGPAWFKAILDLAATAVPNAEFSAIIDCGEEAGTVLAALRLGLTHVRFTGSDLAAERLADIAGQLGVTIEREVGSQVLDLLDSADPEAACRSFLTQAR